MLLQSLQDYDSEELAEQLEELLAYLMKSSPVVRSFLTMAEINFAEVNGNTDAAATQPAVPIVAAAQLGPTVAAAQGLSLIPILRLRSIYGSVF